MFLFRFTSRRAINSATNASEPINWLGELSKLKGSGISLSPGSILDILRVFSDEYDNCRHDYVRKRSMINDKAFIGLLSTSIKDLSLFRPSQLVELVYVLTTRIAWKDTSLLRSAEPVILEHLCNLTQNEVVDCLECFSKLKCGSRQFWESMISALVSVDISDEDVLRVFRMMNDNRKTFYKPSLVVKAFAPRIERLSPAGQVSNEDIRNIISVLSDRENIIGGRVLATITGSLLPRIVWPEADLVTMGDIASNIAELGLSSEEFLENLESYIANIQPQEKSSTKARALEKILTSLYTMSRSSPVSGESFAYLESVLSCQLPNVDMPTLVNSCLIFSRIFHITNSPSEILVNFGPDLARGSDFLSDAHPLLLQRMPFISGRQLSKLLLAFAISRRGNAEMYASMVTMLGQLLSDPEAFSPDDLDNILFSVTELDLDLSDDVKNGLVLACFERLHLMRRSFDVLLFFVSHFFQGEERLKLASQVIELMDPETTDSKRPGLVFLNLALRQIIDKIDDLSLELVLEETGEDLDLFLKSSRSLVHPLLFEKFKKELGSQFNCEHIVENAYIDERGLWVDFLVPDSNVAVLVSSPQLEVDGRPTGTAIMRHQAVEKALGEGWTILNFSASELVNGDIADLISKSLVPVKGSAERRFVRECIVELEPEHNEESFDFNDFEDLSKFVRKDREAAHRPRAPAGDLPWTPSVMTLKQRRRRRNFRK